MLTAVSLCACSMSGAKCKKYGSKSWFDQIGWKLLLLVRERDDEMKHGGGVLVENTLWV